MQHLGFRAAASLQPWGLSAALCSPVYWPGRTWLIWILSAWFPTYTFMHACVCALITLLVSIPQRWTEDEQAQEELPRSWTDSAELWSWCPQVSSVSECVFVKRECLCAPVAGCGLTSLVFFVLKSLNCCLCLNTNRPTPTYITHTLMHITCIQMPLFIHSFSFAPSRKSALAIWPNE